MSLKQQREDFNFDRRSRRPPRSRVNSLLPFFYALITNDCISAAQSAGLDPYIGFLHKERPGRPSLALDLVEEFRAFAERLTFTLINRKQITAIDFEEKPGGIYHFTDAGKRKVLEAYQERKQETITHVELNQKCTIGELPFLQAQILARTIRGDVPFYTPFMWR